MKPEHLQYFKDLIEGRDVPSWHVWWRTHSAECQADLDRLTYLKLKFENVPYAAVILERHGISFAWSAKGRRETAYANLAPEVLDENGRPKPEFRERDGGFVQAFCAGDRIKGESLVKKALKRILRVKDEIHRSEELADFEIDAEQLYDEGYAEAAVAVLRAIAQLKPRSCLEDAPIEYARTRPTQLQLPVRRERNTS